MKILGVYGSRFGQAEAVLRTVAEVLTDAGHTVVVLNGNALPSGLTVEAHDAVLIAASVVMGRHQGYIRRFVRAHARALSARPSAFISVNGTSPESSPEWRVAAERYVERFLRQTGWRPLLTATFAGALRYSRYDPVTRWIMRGISRRSGGPTDTSRDYEFTDWSAVGRFARELAWQLQGARHEEWPAG